MAESLLSLELTDALLEPAEVEPGGEKSAYERQQQPEWDLHARILNGFRVRRATGSLPVRQPSLA